MKEGDILLTRSGTIGRVIYVTKVYHNAITSDDLIRVRIIDEKLRLYVYFFLQTKYAQDQLLRNEYGAVQQHLEPEHVRNVLIPIPEDPKAIERIAEKSRASIKLREELHDLNQTTSTTLINLIESAI